MITREELYELVWSEPMTKVADRYGISGSYMARVCALLNIPRSRRGYWAKVAVGKAPARIALPEAHPGDPLIWSKEGEQLPPPKPPRAPTTREDKPVRIPRKQIHGLVRGAKTHFENSRTIEEGAYLKPYKKLLVDVTASQVGIDKALGFTNDLFNAFESVGHRVVIAPQGVNLYRSHAHIDEREKATTRRDRYYDNGLWSPYRPTVVYVGTVAIGLAIVEMSEEVLLRYVAGKYVRETNYVPPSRSRYSIDRSWTTIRALPSGRLRLIAYSPYRRVAWATTWQEAKGRSFRTEIAAIVKAVEGAAPELVAMLEEADRKAKIAHQQWLIEEQKRRREEDRCRVEQSFRDSQQQFTQVIDRWSDVTAIERFLEGVEKSAREQNDARRDEILERLSLARVFLGSQDPLDFFMSWRTPLEMYRPIYPEDTESCED